MTWRTDYGNVGAVLDWWKGEIGPQELIEILPWKDDVVRKLMQEFVTVVTAGSGTERSEEAPVVKEPIKVWNHAEFKASLPSLPDKRPDGKDAFYTVEWPGPEELLPSVGVVHTYSYGNQSIRVQVMESGLLDDKLVMTVMRIAVVPGAGDRSQ